MQRNRTSQAHDKVVGGTVVRLRLYTSGRSDYTRHVLDTLDRLLAAYDHSCFTFEVRDAAEADESERVFFTPMLIVQDEHDPPQRTVVVGDLRDEGVVKALLARYGLHPRA